MNKKAFLLALFTVILWASTFTGIKLGLQGGYSSGHILFMRFFIASVIFFVYAIIPGTDFRLPKKEDIPRIVFLAFTGISIYHFGITFGAKTVSPGTTSMFVGSAPVFTAIISVVFLKEHPSKVSWFGLFIGFVGIFLIALGTSDQGFTISPGALLVLFAVVGTSFFFVFQKPLLVKYTAIEFTAYITWVGTMSFLLFSPGIIGTIKNATASANLAVLYIGIFPATIAYVTWAMALSLGKASAISSVMYAEPVFGVAIAWLFFKELPSTLSVVGGVVAISSIIIVNFLESKKHNKVKKEMI